MPQHKTTLWLTVAKSVAWAVPSLILLLVAVSWLRDAPPHLVRLDVTPKKECHIGTPINVEVQVACPYYRLPEKPFGLELPNGAQLLNADHFSLAGLGLTGWRWNCRVQLQPYSLGKLTGGNVAVNFTPGRREAPEKISVLLPEMEVTAKLPADEQTLAVAPRLPASAVKTPWKWWHYTILGVLLAAIIAGLLFWRYRHRQQEIAGPPPEPPWEIALRALQDLEQKLPLPPEDFFVIITDILRRYCEARFQVRATESTTPEFLETLRLFPEFTPDQRRALTEFLAMADLIKFARADATQEQLLASLALGRRFVAETKPAPPALETKTPPEVKKEEQKAK